MLESNQGEEGMPITVEAIYESGILRPLEPLEGLNEHDRVRLTLQPIGLVAEQRLSRIIIDAETAREIGESAEYSVLSD